MKSDFWFAEIFFRRKRASTRRNQGAAFVVEKTGKVTLGVAATVGAGASWAGVPEASASGISAGGGVTVSQTQGSPLREAGKRTNEYSGS